jgi:murein DD-endopeptidase MepM/ murein hydrolase activator NlpD
MPHRFRLLRIALCSIMAWHIPGLDSQAQIQRLELNLPTSNRSIFGPDPSQFYMYTNRSFEGRKNKPWQGGKYGYVRTPKRTSAGILYTKFHEGIDIRPSTRDRRNTPLDPVRSIASGKVTHVSNIAGASNYGRYIVIEHDWGYGKFYSLYAHLAAVTCRTGQPVSPGTVIGKLGYSGTGLDRTRAHLHLELNLMASQRFHKWYDKYFTSSNRHGIYNGLNLVGLDIAGLYLAHQRNPSITIPQFMSGMRVYWKVLIANKGTPALLKLYPWLARDMAEAKGNPSWEISLSSSGVPLAVAPSKKSVKAATVSWVTYSPTPHAWNTRSRLTGSKGSATLSASGRRYIQQLSGDF